VGRPLEDLAATNRFNRLLLNTARAQAVALRAFERQTRSVLHLWNLPARSDIKRLQRQVGALSAEVQELTVRLEEERLARPSQVGRSNGPTAAKKRA
jgi:hypothetical protein